MPVPSDTLTLTVGDPAAIDLCVILLHGYAMEPEDLAPFARSMGVPGLYCFPRGPWAAATRGRSWWPIDESVREASISRGARDLAREHPSQREPARTLLAGLLRQPPLAGARRVVLAGFSQGGMLACDTLLHEPVRAHALALFSSSRIALEEWQPRRAALAGLPVLVSHGRSDADLAFAAGQALHDWLREAGCRTRWLPFEGGHEIPLQAWREFRRFLREIPPADGSASPVPVPCE
jgi:phospholipase/carboxylesterase